MDVPISDQMKPLVNHYIDVLDKIIEAGISISNKKIRKILSSYFIDYVNNDSDKTEIKTIFHDEIEKHTGLNVIIPDLGITDYNITYTLSENKYIFQVPPLSSILNLIIDVHVPLHIQKKLQPYKNHVELIFIYKILGFDMGNFWGVSPRFYDIIVKNFHNPVECFASPFNNNLDNYFSALEIDKDFGAKGRFQDKFLEDTSETYIINPPFTKQIILDVMKLSTMKLKLASCSLYFYLPYWVDIIDPFVDSLKKEYIVKEYVITAGTSFIYDYMLQKTIPNYSFDLVFIYISNINNSNALKLFNRLRREL